MSTIVAIGHLFTKDDSNAFFSKGIILLFSYKHQEIMELLKETDEEMCDDDDVLDPTYRSDDSEEEVLEEIEP